MCTNTTLTTNDFSPHVKVNTGIVCELLNFSSLMQNERYRKSSRVYFNNKIPPGDCHYLQVPSKSNLDFFLCIRTGKGCKQNKKACVEQKKTEYKKKKKKKKNLKKKGGVTDKLRAQV